MCLLNIYIKKAVISVLNLPSINQMGFNISQELKFLMRENEAPHGHIQTVCFSTLTFFQVAHCCTLFVKSSPMWHIRSYMKMTPVKATEVGKYFLLVCHVNSKTIWKLLVWYLFSLHWYDFHSCIRSTCCNVTQLSFYATVHCFNQLVPLRTWAQHRLRPCCPGCVWSKLAGSSYHPLTHRIVSAPIQN